MAKQRYVVAVKKNNFGGQCEQGRVLGPSKGYREVEFAKHDLDRLAEDAKLGTSQVGIFLDRRLVR